MNVALESPDNAELIDLRAIAAVVLSRRWWFVGCLLIFTGAFVAKAFLSTPIYRATTVLVPTASERGQGSLSSALGQIGGLASLAGINVGSSSLETEEALAVLRSREFGERFIHDRGLLPKLFPGQWDAKRGKWKVPDSEQPSSARAFKYFDRVIRSVEQDKKTGLVTLQIDWRDREEAADWANDIVVRLNAEMRQRAVERADANLNFLMAQMETTVTLETREAISRLIEGQIKQRMLANVTKEYALRVIDRALPADPKDPISPRRLMLIALGILLGMAFGVGGALAVGRKAPAK